MKKKYLILDFFEFSLIIFAFVVPSFLAESQSTVFLDVRYPTFPILIRLSIIIYLLTRMYDMDLISRQHTHFSVHVFKNYGIQSLKIYAMLFLVGITINTFLYIIQYQSTTIIAEPPGDILLWLWFLLSVTILACFEEIVFRQFLPEKTLNNLKECAFYQTSPTKIKKILYLFIEFVFILFFAFGHMYLGVFAVIASLISGLILRYSVKKYNSIVPACVAHSLNNIISFLAVFYVL